MMKYDLEYTVKDRDAGMTVRGVCRKRLGVSQRLVRKISNSIRSGENAFTGGVYVDGRPALFIDRVNEGDTIGIVYPDEVSDFVPQDIPIDILYEDDDIIAVNKQPGIVVHPTKGHVDGTIANGLMFRMQERGERYKIRFANRLDMNTSGVLLIGKNAHAQSEFARQSEAGHIRKIYLAVLDGAPEQDTENIDLPIALESEGSPRRTVREDGAPSRTFYRVLERYGCQVPPNPVIAGDRGRSPLRIAPAVIAGDRGRSPLRIAPAVIAGDRGRSPLRIAPARNDGNSGGRIQASLALISITTGRTHQIRVHMAHIGCPVLGDELYGRRAPGGLIERQALHAAVLRFMHPQKRTEITIKAPMPVDMIECLQEYRSLML